MRNLGGAVLFYAACGVVYLGAKEYVKKEKQKSFEQGVLVTKVGMYELLVDVINEKTDEEKELKKEQEPN